MQYSQKDKKNLWLPSQYCGLSPILKREKDLAHHISLVYSLCYLLSCLYYLDSEALSLTKSICDRHPGKLLWGRSLGGSWASPHLAPIVLFPFFWGLSQRMSVHG